ncbi:TonB-dependent receptor [Sphingomonas abietis]|uniref:TonB-dependent receptor n=1 Tax=Sphingomonas abietis TaxID=3012344 RepID=A0ABY7NJQ9_9SPHN|nr:TonB-dependent receptor [Sphingomonas abietis]WBO21777.1 TonB-dependent receptor [Sphingomonas abietis]
MVTGARQEQRSSIEVKRRATVIADGIVDDEIGALPDNSVADTLERIPGVTGDRFKGNANDPTVRGLGPTLNFMTINGREASAAGIDRSVSFQQFPSELISGVMVYKTQRADFLEGGIGGVIDLRTARPLEAKGSRLTGEILGSYFPKDAAIRGRNGLGYRADITYLDQFHTGLGDIGISIGLRRQDSAAPEDYYNGNANFVPCTTAASNGTLVSGTPPQLAAAGAGTNCANATVPRAGVGEKVGQTYYATQSRSFREQQTHELRNAAFGTLEWKPAANLDIDVDAQYSRRNSTENRNVLQITEGLRGISPILIGDGTNGWSKGALIAFSGNSFLEDQLELRERDETYLGVGTTVRWTPGRWTIEGDASLSQSHRTESQRQTRMRSNTRVGYTLDYRNSPLVPAVTFNTFDVTDPANFDNTAATAVYARNRLVTDRHDDIYAGRLDVEYALDGFVTSIKIGGRYSEQHRTLAQNANNDLNTLVPSGGKSVADIINGANLACRTSFPSSSFFPSTGTLMSWATFDDACLFRSFAGSDTALPFPSDRRDPSDINVRERITAFYAMANFAGSVGSTPFSGNIGVRYVQTSISSIGYRLPFVVTIDSAADNYTVSADPTGSIATEHLGGSYRYWLPSANIALDLSFKTKLRLALYRALARTGIESFGAGINLNPTAGPGGADSVTFNATSGNPSLKPLRGWNADASLEFYLARDTVFSAAIYGKWLRGTVISGVAPIPTVISVNTIVDGRSAGLRDYSVNLIAPANDQELRHLYGIELSGSHALTWAPGLLSGLGVIGSLNIAEANFQYPDTSALAAYLDPANLPGLSRYVASGTVYWERAGLSLRANYRYRSAYPKPNGGTNRSVQGAGYLNLSAQYQLSQNVRLKLQAMNVTGTKDVFVKGGSDSIAEVSDSGPQYYAGVQFRF